MTLSGLRSVSRGEYAPTTRHLEEPAVHQAPSFTKATKSLPDSGARYPGSLDEDGVEQHVLSLPTLTDV